MGGWQNEARLTAYFSQNVCDRTEKHHMDMPSVFVFVKHGRLSPVKIAFVSTLSLQIEGLWVLSC